ncbi:MAG TPA: hypothetical protein VFC25_01960, partial [Verrucomicrobiae bacterium]|nr:hypothetical protein [Verrucomicrobiae bacterium]
MRTLRRLLPLVFCFLLIPADGRLAAAAGAADDVAAARSLFEKNLDAIKRKDKDAYLACYLNSPAFVKTGADGSQRGYDRLAKEAG